MSIVRALVVVVMAAVMMTGCASKATWADFQQSEIAAWKALDVPPEEALMYGKAGLTPADVSEWQDAGLRGAKTVLAWREAGFAAAEAGDWNTGNFTMEQAIEWRAAKFSATEGRSWKKGGFDLEDAIENRGKGLKPIE